MVRCTESFLRPLGSMFKNFIAALKLASVTPKRIVLQTGAKNYGVHLGPALPPAVESDPRVMIEPNFCRFTSTWSVCHRNTYKAAFRLPPRRRPIRILQRNTDKLQHHPSRVDHRRRPQRSNESTPPPRRLRRRPSTPQPFPQLPWHTRRMAARAHTRNSHADGIPDRMG